MKILASFADKLYVWGSALLIALVIKLGLSFGFEAASVIGVFLLMAFFVGCSWEGHQVMDTIQALKEKKAELEKMLAEVQALKEKRAELGKRSQELALKERARP